MKIGVLGCGLRTPLLIHGLAHSGLPISRVALYDTDATHAQIMTQLGGIIAAGTRLQVTKADSPPQAIDGSSFVISSIRVGNMETRARDERLALSYGFAGQETTGPAGFAMALRTVPKAIEHARIVEKAAPDAWIVNFTNPAGLITQAISQYSGARVVGVCDTPSELFFRIACALNQPQENVQCDYLGLNHLGWVRAVRVLGQDVTNSILDNDALLDSLYPSKLFAPELIRALKLIPTEYVFFYYSQRLAVENQQRACATRGEELLAMSPKIWSELEAGILRENPAAALESYRSYLNRRNASYLRLEGEAGSALNQADPGWDPFAAATGYHRIAVDAIRGLSGAERLRMVLNVPNNGAMGALAPEDVVEVPCEVTFSRPHPLPVGMPPEEISSLIIAVKTFERLAIRAAVERSWPLATLALFTNPIVREWNRAAEFCKKLSTLEESWYPPNWG